MSSTAVSYLCWFYVNRVKSSQVAFNKNTAFVTNPRHVTPFNFYTPSLSRESVKAVLAKTCVNTVQIVADVEVTIGNYFPEVENTA